MSALDPQLLRAIIGNIIERTKLGSDVARQCQLAGNEEQAADAYKETLALAVESLQDLDKRLEPKAVQP